MKEVVPIFNESTGVCKDCTALEIASEVDAPDEVISYLAHATHQLSLPISHWPGESLMEMNWNLDLIKTVSDESEWTEYEHMFHPQKEGSYHKRAFYHLHNDDPEIVVAQISQAGKE